MLTRFCMDKYHETLRTVDPVRAVGRVRKIVGMVIEASGPATQIGCVCDIATKNGGPPISAEVLGFKEDAVLLMPLSDIHNLGPGCTVVARHAKAHVGVGRAMLGRVIDGLGNPIDDKGAILKEKEYPIHARPLNPLLRAPIRTPLDMGIRAINGLLTVGCGQRMGIFAGSGVGKSVLLGMIARQTAADVNVIALIGERGRELNEFIQKDLGTAGLEKSVVVVATADHPPLVRLRGGFIATAIAEFFRDLGMHVNLMMDSVTRLALAQREIGLSLGEPPTTKGYPPSVFAMLPRLLERTGTGPNRGTITGLYTVLVEGDDMSDPIADAVRSILDGHIVLSRSLADRNHYPAIDILKSVSRVMNDVSDADHQRAAGTIKEIMATYRQAEDLINIGAYVDGSSQKIDTAIRMIEAIHDYLKQAIDEAACLAASTETLKQLARSG